MEAIAKATWEVAKAVKGVLDIGVGQPHKDLLPREKIARAAARALACDSNIVRCSVWLICGVISLMQDVRDLLQYSANIGTSGFLRAVASFTQSSQGHFIMTNGSSQAIDLCATALAQPGDTILVEDPTYFLAYGILREAHLNLVPVRQAADQGIDVDELESALEKGTVRPKLLYIIPSYNNPTGATISLSNRARIVTLAKKHNFIVMCSFSVLLPFAIIINTPILPCTDHLPISADEAYQHMWFETPPPPSMIEVARSQGAEDHVVSLGSFSKLIAPGLRFVIIIEALRSF